LLGPVGGRCSRHPTEAVAARAGPCTERFGMILYGKLKFGKFYLTNCKKRHAKRFRTPPRPLLARRNGNACFAGAHRMADLGADLSAHHAALAS
jgi:hypothetical protein